MSEIVLGAVKRKQVIERLARLLKAFHEAHEKKRDGFESVSWRGQLGGFRDALGTVLGQRATGEILQAVRQQTGLGFPHGGPVQDDGNILGFDSEAAHGL